MDDVEIDLWDLTLLVTTNKCNISNISSNPQWRYPFIFKIEFVFWVYTWKLEHLFYASLKINDVFEFSKVNSASSSPYTIYDAVI